jgi:hypothetical protein
MFSPGTPTGCMHFHQNLKFNLYIHVFIFWIKLNYNCRLPVVQWINLTMIKLWSILKINENTRIVFLAEFLDLRGKGGDNYILKVIIIYILNIMKRAIIFIIHLVLLWINQGRYVRQDM